MTVTDVIGPDGLEQQVDVAYPSENSFSGLSQPVISKIYRDIEIPDSLYHYTSSAGLIGIITGHTLWFSDAAFMNDGSETTYGVRAASLAIDEFMADKPASEKEVADLLKNEIEQAATHLQPIIFCLSARNNLLNQWRDYGKDVVPYCIEFDTRELERWRDRSLNFPVFATKVVYEADMQRELLRELVSEIYKRTMSLLGSRTQFDEKEGELLVRSAAIEIMALITRFKNPAFEAEEEWRLVCYRPDVEPKAARKYRVSSLGAVPYYEWKREGEELHFPIRSVTVGPSPYAAVSDLALKQMLRDNGYVIPTYFSLIPLRR